LARAGAQLIKIASAAGKLRGQKRPMRTIERAVVRFALRVGDPTYRSQRGAS
jgi:hypothetical protein